MKRLAEIRKSNGISGKEFAKALGIPPQTLSGYEKCKREPPIKTMIKMSEILNCSIDELVGNDVKRKES